MQAAATTCPQICMGIVAKDIKDEVDTGAKTLPACCRSLNDGTGQEQPDFLPMFPWYSGTSADMYRTMIDLVISVKLFLGRFDMRTMEVGHCFGLHNPPPAQESGTEVRLCLGVEACGSSPDAAQGLPCAC